MQNITPFSNLKYPHNLLFITSNLGGGGAERALVNILNNLDRDHFQPHLALFQKEGVFLEELAPDVPLSEVQSGKGGFLARNWTRSQNIYNLCKKISPAAVMSIKWQANAVTLLTAKFRRLGVPIIINEQSAPQASLKSDSRRRLLWPLAKHAYRWADKIIAISQGIAQELQHTAKLPPNKLRVIHNPLALTVEPLSSVTLTFKKPGVPAILAAGRLTPLKNYPLLLKATAKVLQTQPVDLFILGIGPEKATIEALAQTLGITPHVHLLGFVSEPQNYIHQADIFALTSNHEGFGNVLVEAMSLGVPVISTDCPYGPREILQDGKYGLLVPVGDEDALAVAILDLLRNLQKRHELGLLGRKRAEDFSIEKIIPLYEKVFLELIEKSI